MIINRIYRFLRGGVPRGKSINDFTAGFVRVNNYRVTKSQISARRKEWQKHVNTIPAYPRKFSGRGIVICAGGYTYITCAWINISMLRKRGCTLPIELWFEGREINEHMIREFARLGATCVNCRDFTQSDLTNYAMKPFAILNSAFKEVLYLDADNNCVEDPSYLFDSDEYTKHGALFWPDTWSTDDKNAIWKIVGPTDVEIAEQESGQVLINKELCWRELNLCMFFNMQRDFYYKILLGDKDTFKFAWAALGTKYHMIPLRPALAGFVDAGGRFCGMSMLQHAPDGRFLFLHRNLLKWGQTKDNETLWMKIKRVKGNGKDANLRQIIARFRNTHMDFVDIDGDIEEFSFEDVFGQYELECLELLRELRGSRAYNTFLIDQFLVKTRPGYSEDPVLPIFRNKTIERSEYFL